METQKRGFIRSWIRKGKKLSYGIVRVSMCESYFVHHSEIAELPEGGLIGREILFDVAPPINSGKMSRAVAITLLPLNPPAELSALGGTL